MALYVALAGGAWLYHQLAVRDLERDLSDANTALIRANDSAAHWWRTCSE